ncbi:hypothetical protein M0811_02981 [Anaeramoeba ignava]|uniref:Uncharacterized protein n=1 Tax=Anaeramoeba ignava TaxID=1746090 RepID=A0A9Q0L7H6_ANAIG|nr:hypothetical protein M0811_02981 [Anaeramoeba ignava]
MDFLIAEQINSLSSYKIPIAPLLKKKKQIEMKIKPLFSSLAKEEEIKKLVESTQKRLEKNQIQAQMIEEGNLKAKKPNAFYLLTGGTEHLVLDQIQKHKFDLDEPIFIVSHSKMNSLPAALEVSARLRRDQRNVSIIHFNDPLNEIDFGYSYLKNIVSIFQTKKALSNVRIGLFGKPSDWLVNSDLDHIPSQQILKKVFGIDLIYIPLEKIKKEFVLEQKKDSRNELISRRIIQQEYPHFDPKKLDEYSLEELKKSVAVSEATRKLVSEYSLQALSLRCFDLLFALKTTGCLSLSQMNDMGIMASCEGDLPSLYSMILSHLLSESPKIFMANLQEINPQLNQITFAHCTTPLSFFDQNYIIRSHFESGIGIAFQGIQNQSSKETEVTVSRFDLKDRKLFAKKGKLQDSKHNPNMCRTQLQISFPKDVFKVESILENAIANHHIITKKNIEEQLLLYHKLFISNKN